MIKKISHPKAGDVAQLLSVPAVQETPDSLLITAETRMVPHIWIPGLRRYRQKDGKFKGILGYVVIRGQSTDNKEGRQC